MKTVIYVIGVTNYSDSEMQPNTYPVHVFVNVERKLLRNSIEQLKTIPEIQYILPVTGRFDIVLRLSVTEHQKVYTAIQRIRQVQGILDTQTLMPYEGFQNGEMKADGQQFGFVLISAQKQVSEVLKWLKSLPNVVEGYVVPGQFDILLTLRAKNWQEILATSFEKFEAIDGIRRTETLFAYNPIWK